MGRSTLRSGGRTEAEIGRSELRSGCPLIGIFAGIALATALGACTSGEASSSGETSAVSAPPPAARNISALGRLEPEDGIIRVAGPSGATAVISELRVDHGDRVKRGQLIAVLDTVEMNRATVARLEAELGNARRELERHLELNTNRVVSDSQRDEWETRVRVAEAELDHARAELKRAHVTSPIDGRVLEVRAREGERVGERGIVEVGKTDHMFAIAEVYEDDIGRVKIGQVARMTSPALPEPLTGKVDWINLNVAVQNALGTDPAARKDARVVEVEIRLDESEAAAGLTNLQVEVEIEP